ncbi:MAG: hypothetical protein GXY83_15305 [Rhodopirellula sp.]|nr:hypothetical protein [Rhodopirellula sp.]
MGAAEFHAAVWGGLLQDVDGVEEADAAGLTCPQTGSDGGVLVAVSSVGFWLEGWCWSPCQAEVCPGGTPQGAPVGALVVSAFHAGVGEGLFQGVAPASGNVCEVVANGVAPQGGVVSISGDGACQVAESNVSACLFRSTNKNPKTAITQKPTPTPARTFSDSPELTACLSPRLERDSESKSASVVVRLGIRASVCRELS